MASAAVASSSSPTSTTTIAVNETAATARTNSNRNNDTDISSAATSPPPTMTTATRTVTAEHASFNGQQLQQQELHQKTGGASSTTAEESAAANNTGDNNAATADATKLPAATIDTNNNAIPGSDNPLPQDLQRILLEVAKTGACPWLAWEQELPTSASSEGVANHPTAATTSTGASAETVPPAAATATQNSSSTHNNNKNSQDAKTPVAACAAAGLPPSRQPFAAAASARRGPPRKKHRNGIHKSSNVGGGSGSGGGSGGGGGGGNMNAASSRMRFGNLDGASSGSSSRKRPLLHSSAPSSVGSSRTSGSELDYECDSEGTTATTNSEVSVERMRKTHHQLAAAHLSGGGNPGAHPNNSGDQLPVTGRCDTGSLPYKTLQAAVRNALGLVLDHFYHTRGGYRLSPAERRRNDTSEAMEIDANTTKTMDNSNSGEDANKKLTPLSAEDVYLQRREKLMMMLLPSSSQPKDVSSRLKLPDESYNPPFTIQRVAEVLISPERYYTQTHKLCNCLEKLLLVTSSTAAFGGITGGDTSQSRREERELAALADEKGKQESTLRQKRLQRRTSSPTNQLLVGDGGDGAALRSTEHDNSQDRAVQGATAASGEKNTDEDPSKHSHARGGESGSDSTSREMLEAAARASLRTKFDHVGIDPHHSMNARDVRAIAENRGMTNSPPPPSLAMPAAAVLPGHAGVAGFVMQHLPDHSADHRGVGRVPSPILFSGNDHSHLTEASNRHMLQLHHAVSTAGAPLNQNNLELMARTHNNLGPASAENADLDGDHGRSSASNSDIDSESDDISFDDSASDRSDGSDYGYGSHFEPSTPARAMALNRIQQQRRLESRALTASSLHQNEAYKPPADTEYQSGDSIDSTRAEDSGGSDSSDMAD